MLHQQPLTTFSKATSEVCHLSKIDMVQKIVLSEVVVGGDKVDLLSPGKVIDNMGELHRHEVGGDRVHLVVLLDDVAFHLVELQDVV